MPAPLKNSNALKHGLTTGKLPPGASYITNLTNKFRRELEAAALEVRGEIGLYELAVVNTAIRWERHALLAQKWLRDATDSLTPDQRLAFSREVARASSERDKCLRLLGLDARARGDLLTLETLYATEPTGGESEDEGGPPDT